MMEIQTNLQATTKLISPPPARWDLSFGTHFMPTVASHRLCRFVVYDDDQRRRATEAEREKGGKSQPTQTKLSKVSLLC